MFLNFRSFPIRDPTRRFFALFIHVTHIYKIFIYPVIVLRLQKFPKYKKCKAFVFYYNNVLKRHEKNRDHIFHARANSG